MKVSTRPSKDVLPKWGAAIALGLCLFLGVTTSASHAETVATPAQKPGGILFSCPREQRAVIADEMTQYLRSLDIRDDWVRIQSPGEGGVLYTLQAPETGRGTLGFKYAAELAPGEEAVFLPAKAGRERQVHTVSRKEIVLALLHRGRLTEFKSAGCSVASLKDHVGIRQNTVAWAEQLELGWPDGDVAEWNPRYWNRGTPQPGHSLHEAVNDIFLNQDQYVLGCYAATKLVMIQGVLDYYHRIKRDLVALQRVEQTLLNDGQPLVDVEPGRMWDFEDDFDRLELNRPGKILDIQYGIPADNFVPGDWAYFLNTDMVTYQKTGYEGSNAIYLGHDKFDDYYNDNGHSYSFEEKLNEVYQWRHGVFSRSRDASKMVPLMADDFMRLSKTPQEGGLLLNLRVSHQLFDLAR